MNTKYVRKRVDFNLFDDIGHGHKIHATLFNMIPPEMERQTSIGGGGGSYDMYPSFDVDSIGGSEYSAKGSTLGRRRSSFGKNSNYMSIGGRGANKRGTTSGSSNRFPTLPTAFPKAPSNRSFPVVPESPYTSDTSRTPSEVYPEPIYGDQTNDYKKDELEGTIHRQESFDLPLPPPPPESPPPEFPPLDPEFDSQAGVNSSHKRDTITMLPPPDFD